MVVRNYEELKSKYDKIIGGLDGEEAGQVGFKYDEEIICSSGLENNKDYSYEVACDVVQSGVDRAKELQIIAEEIARRCDALAKRVKGGNTEATRTIALQASVTARSYIGDLIARGAGLFNILRSIDDIERDMDDLES